MKNQPLSETTQAVYAFIRQYRQEHGYSPSLREIGEGCYVGRSTVYRHLDQLVMKGFITRDLGRARGINLTGEGDEEPEE